jgi:hypothetical protein
VGAGRLATRRGVGCPPKRRISPVEGFGLRQSKTGARALSIPLARLREGGVREPVMVQQPFSYPGAAKLTMTG